MTFLRLPLILAAVMMLRRVDGSCVEDNCYGALYWNPAGAEECSDHFVTTVVPVPTTTTVTITSNVAELTTITGAPVVTGVVIPSLAIPTYIQRACYGDISYRFESACSCIEAGPTTTMIAQPTITDTVVFPGTGGVPPNPPVSPVVPVPPPVSPIGPVSPPSPFPSPPASGSLSSGLAEPTCVPIPGPVIVTVQVDTLYMTLTMAGSTLCLGNSTAPPAPSSGCNCPSTLPSSVVPALSSSFTTLANTTTSFISSGSFSTVRRTSFSGYSNTSSAAATSDEEPSSTTPAPTTLVTSQTPAESTAEAASSTEESSSAAESTNAAEASSSSTAEEPSSTTAAAAESSSTAAESSEAASSTTQVPSTTTPQTTTPSTTTSTSATAGPTHFVPNGPSVLLQIVSGALDGQYIASDPPTSDRPTNLRSHTSPDVDAASVWTLDAPTGILFQKIGDAWWGAWFGFGSRTQWGAIQLLPADTIVSWLVAPVSAKAPLRCVIDFTAANVITCGQQLWTRLMQSDKCGWAITTPFNPTYAAACPASEELFLRAIVVNPEVEGIN